MTEDETTELELTALESGLDGSMQCKMTSKKGGTVHYSLFEDELYAHTWECPGEGKIFLRALEDEAKKQTMGLTVPTVLSPKLAKILFDNGYRIHNEFIGPPYNEKVEFWRKK